MYYSSYETVPRIQERVSTFGGYCNRDVIGDGQFSRMQNMSAAKYPAITTRTKRQRLTRVDDETLTNVAAICDKDGLVWLDKDGGLHAGGNVLKNFYTWDERERQLISMGGYLIVWPDKLWANAARLKLGQQMRPEEDYGSLEASWEQANETPTDSFLGQSGNIRIVPCRPDGNYWKYVPSGGIELSLAPTAEDADDAEEQYAVVTSSYPYRLYKSPKDSTTWTDLGDYYGFSVYNMGFTWGEQFLPNAEPPDGHLYWTGKNPYPLSQWSESAKKWTPVECLLRIETMEPVTGIAIGDAVKLSMPEVWYHVYEGSGRTYLGYAIETKLKAEELAAVIAVGEITEDNELGMRWYMAVKSEQMAAGSAAYNTMIEREYKPIMIQSYHRQLTYAYYTNGEKLRIPPLWDQAEWKMTDNELKDLLQNENPALLEKLRPVTISRTTPQMDYVIECGNRLWGCYYGQGPDGQILNEIYASKLGDFKNWNSFQGLSTDSYAASRGTDGPWTGAIAMNNYPLFFKRNYLEKVYTSASGAHQIATTRMPGVQPGSWQSMQIVDGVLFYLSDNGVMVYDGSLPDHISTEFGPVKYKNGVAGKLGYTYYLSVQDPEGEYTTFALDTSRGLWHREDDMRFVQSADRGDVLYLLDQDGGLYAPGAIGETDEATLEGDFTWELVTGPIGYDRAEQEHLLRLIPRLKLEPGASARLYVEYDSNGNWQRVACLEGNETKSISVPVRPRRCDHFRLRLQGIGEATLYSLTREIEKGSTET